MMARRERDLFAMMGFAGPIVFTVLVITQGLLQPDYSHVRMPVSALAAWPLGWIQQLNFFIAATCLAAFVVGLHRSIAQARWGILGITLMLLGAVGMVVAGIFSWQMVNGEPKETPPHVVGAILFFFCSSAGLVVLSRRLAADARWRDLSGYVLTTGIAMLIMFFVMGWFAIEDGTPLHPWAGLLQRVAVCVWFACQFVLAIRMRRVDPSAAR
jgi:hypothetical membrane protein